MSNHSAFANLGETVAEVDARYGKPVEIASSATDQRRIYRREGLEFDILIVSGESLRETVHRPGKDNHLTPEECLQWAKTLSGAADWKLETGNELSAVWKTGGLLAAKARRPDDGSDYFSVYGRGFMAYFQSKQRSDGRSSANRGTNQSATNSSNRPSVSLAKPN